MEDKLKGKMSAGSSKRKLKEYDVETKAVGGRKKNTVIRKNVIQEELHNLTLSFGKLDCKVEKSEMQMQFFKDMHVQQSDVIAFMHGLMEEYKNMIENVKSNASTVNARSTDLNVEVGSNTLEFGQFIDESAIVLHRYTQNTVMKMEVLNESFGRFAVEWTKKQNALKEKAIALDGEQRKLNIEFLMLKRNM